MPFFITCAFGWAPLVFLHFYPYCVEYFFGRFVFRCVSISSTRWEDRLLPLLDSHCVGVSERPKIMGRDMFSENYDQQLSDFKFQKSICLVYIFLSVNTFGGLC